MYNSSRETHLRATECNCHMGSRVLPATQHRSTCPTLTAARQAGTQFNSAFCPIRVGKRLTTSDELAENKQMQLA